MGDPLTKDSRMECARRGSRPPSFVCGHLQHGAGLGFNEPVDEPDPDMPFRQAWCDDCDAVLKKEGEWNDVSEGHAKITLICEGCFFEIRQRNSTF